MNLPKELVPDKKTKYLVPNMKFNLGTLKYEPEIPKTLSNEKLPKRTKISIWALGIILISIIVILFVSLFY
jgi:hypothetical protein